MYAYVNRRLIAQAANGKTVKESPMGKLAGESRLSPVAMAASAANQFVEEGAYVFVTGRR
jgi:hypothetical protein